jgi:hypothetical protein
MLDSMRRHYDEFRLEVSCFAGRRYPSFVTAQTPILVEDDVPAFVFHSIEPAEFEAQLRYLADGGYNTLSADQFLRHLDGTEPAPPRSVLLTIDDGRASVWSCGLPLLKKYGAKAVVFLIPGYVPHAKTPSPSLEDAWSGRCSSGDVSSRDPALMSWIEIKVAAASGLVDFQAHTLYHHRAPVGERIVDYINPSMRSVPLFDLPIQPGQEETLLSQGIESFYGAPVYENDSLMSGRPRFRGDAELDRACIAHVAAAGRAAFFQSFSWRSELDGVVAKWRERCGARGALEDRASLHAAMVDDLRRTRQMLEEHLPGHQVRHLCLPYTIGSPEAVRAARAAGYTTCFWGVLRDRRSNRPGEDPYRCPRLKADYIFRLPGRSRRSLGAVLAHKVTRRLSSRPVY